MTQERRSSRPEMIWSHWVDGTRQETADLETALAAAEAGEGYVWVGLHRPTEETMERLGDQLGIHELVVEDAVQGHRRSKLERYGEDLFMVASTVSYVDREQDTAEIVHTGELMIVLGPYWVLTSRQRGRSRMTEVQAEMDRPRDDMPPGPWRVLQACLSVAAQDYLRVAEQMEDDVEEAEEAVFGERPSVEVDRPYEIKRELIEFRRAVAPLCGPLAQLATQQFAAIPEDARPYFRELSDTLVGVRENVSAMEDQLTNILQAAVALVSVHDNRDMRKISAGVAVLAVPTTIGAVYGMNFSDIPELKWAFGYPVVMAVNFLLMLGMYLWFRRIRWL